MRRDKSSRAVGQNTGSAAVAAADTDAASELARVRQLLLDRRNTSGWWTGRLSTSALSTATAVMAQLWHGNALRMLQRNRGCRPA